MTKNDDEGFNVGRAELFEAMGHPNRIRILKALSDTPLGFSELKRTLSMESSGLLSFHLQKLSNLVKTTSEGAYALTDEGKEALQQMMQQKEDKRLAELAWRVVYLKQEDGFTPITEERDRQAHLHHPFLKFNFEPKGN